MVLNGAPHAKRQRALQCVAGSWWRLGKRNQGVHIPAKSFQVICTLSSLLTPAMTDLAEQLTPFTSIVPLNFEAATVSHNPEGFTAPV